MPVIAANSPQIVQTLRRPQTLAGLVGVVLDTTPPFLSRLVKAAAAAGDVTPEMLVGPGRERGLVALRHAAMWIAYHASVRSLPEIGRAFRRDHSTVLHAVRSVDGLVDSLSDETIALVQRIVLQFVRRSPTTTLVEEIQAAAATADARQRKRAEERQRAAEEAAAVVSARRRRSLLRAGSAAAQSRTPGSREWFAANDAVFTAGMIEAHPELAPAGAAASAGGAA